MKTRNAVVLLVIMVFSFLFTNCVVFWGFYPYTDYKGNLDISQGYFRVTLGISQDFDPPLTPAIINDEGGRYEPYIYVTASEGKFIKNVIINKVVVYAGENEYSMDRKEINHVSTFYKIYKKRIDYEYTSVLSLARDDLNDIRRTGLIEINSLVDHVPDFIITNEDDFFTVSRISISFSRVMLLYKGHPKIRIHYDFSAELTTGETITVNQEVVAKRRVRVFPEYSFIGTV